MADPRASELYLGIGKQHDHDDLRPQYIGLSKNLSARLANHHKLPLLTTQTTIWLGEIVNAEPGGRRSKATSASLDYAEWLHAYFLQLPMNEKKTANPPERPVSVLNRWWRTDYATPWIRRPHPSWPDFIDFMSSTLPAKIVWFGKRLLRINHPFDAVAVNAAQQ